MTTAPLSGQTSVAALYCFAPLEDLAAVRLPLLDVCREGGVRGTLLLAEEGVNGTIAGTEDALEKVVAHIRSWPGFADMDVKYSTASAMPFLRLKVRLKREIVTMGVADVDAAHDKGHYVDPAEWNALISDPDTVLIDTRNDYEVRIGTFRGAIDPETKSFREFPQWFDDHAERWREEGRKVAMFCTGGIRCEKATAYVRQQGFDNVFHLKGGILKYLETVEQDASLFDGECFVFDQRVSVKHGLAEGEAELCHGCRHPLYPEDLASEDYEAGVACPHCAAARSEADRVRYRERQRQMELAERSGQNHLGADAGAGRSVGP
ncbi:MAG: rhodanese-related sulfurtransferase [Blastomonas sp.]